MRFSTFATGALAAAVVAAHPGEDAHIKEKERLARRTFLDNVEKRDLSHCAAKLKARGVTDRNMQRRADKVAALRRDLGLPANYRRDANESLNTDHESDANYTIDTSADVIFASNSSCVLFPEVTLGPYYVAGEYILQNITQGQTGVPIHLELQVVDVDTCEPIENVYSEIWAANSTGVYSGVVASGNGNSEDDNSNLNATWLRGAQPTDEDGVVIFDTLVPGHYTGRTNHYHVLVHLNATAQDNGTLIDTTASHIGQLFFDQDLLDEVEALEPYSSNTQDYTNNEADSILAESSVGADPFIEYIILGDSLDQGLLGWISFGINTSYTTTANPASYFYETGGVSNSNGGGGGGGGGFPGGNGSGFPGGDGSGTF